MVILVDSVCLLLVFIVFQRAQLLYAVPVTNRHRKYETTLSITFGLIQLLVVLSGFSLQRLLTSCGRCAELQFGMLLPKHDMK